MRDRHGALARLQSRIPSKPNLQEAPESTD
jgi:hypothetical protein